MKIERIPWGEENRFSRDSTFFPDMFQVKYKLASKETGQESICISTSKILKLSDIEFKIMVVDMLKE